MNLKQYLHGLDIQEREKLAESCGSTLGHMRNVMYGYRPCSAELATAIERHTGRAVTRKDLRPDDWFDVWPELASPSERRSWMEARQTASPHTAPPQEPPAESASALER